MHGTYISGFLKKVPFGKMGHFCPKLACCHSSGATLRNILKFCIMKVASLILNSKGHALYILYLVTLSVSVWITPSLLVLVTCPVHFSLISVLNIYCILCLDITSNHSLYIKLCIIHILYGLIHQRPMFPII